MKTFEEKISDTNFKLHGLQRLRRILLESLDNIYIQSRRQNRFLAICLYLLSKIPKPGESNLRHLVTRLFPFPKLRGMPSDIHICIFTVEKDLEILELSILGAVQSSRNSISEVTVVAPEFVRFHVSEILFRLSKSAEGRTSFSYLSDEQLMSDFDLENFEFIRPNIKMEIIKILACLKTKAESILLIDGDTVLLKPRIWITDKEQILTVAQEFTPSHIKYSLQFLNSTRHSGLGFVTHHQIVRRSIIAELVQSKGGLLPFVNDFNLAATNFYLADVEVFPSEWQLLGDFLFLRYPETVVLSSFKNLGMSRKKIKYFRVGNTKSAQSELDRMKDAAPGLASVSFHGYKD